MKINAKNGYDIRFIKNNTYALLVTFKDIEEDLRSAFFTVKENPDDAPIFQKSLGNGIFKVDDRAYKKEKKYKVQLQAEDSTPLEANVQYLYDLQVTIGNVVKTVASGLLIVSPTITGNLVIVGNEIVAETTDELETEFETTTATVGIEYEQDPVATAKIGDLETLETENKENVVVALNEVKNGVDGQRTALNNAIVTVGESLQDEAVARANGDAEAVKLNGDQTIAGKKTFGDLQATLFALGLNAGKLKYTGSAKEVEWELPASSGTLSTTKYVQDYVGSFDLDTTDFTNGEWVEATADGVAIDLDKVYQVEVSIGQASYLYGFCAFYTGRISTNSTTTVLIASTTDELYFAYYYNGTVRVQHQTTSGDSFTAFRIRQIR